MVNVGHTSHEIPPIGRVFTVLTDDPRAPLHWLAMLNHEQHISISVYSRLSPQRLSNHISLQSIEFKWLSENNFVKTVTKEFAIGVLNGIIFAIKVQNPSEYGVVKFDKNMKAEKIVEKPENINISTQFCDISNHR